MRLSLFFFLHLVAFVILLIVHPHARADDGWVIKGSHKKKLFSHHGNDNYFVGKINTKKNKINLKKSVSLTGKAGSVAFFHCRTIHGSGLNHTNGSRPLILFGYRAL